MSLEMCISERRSRDPGRAEGEAELPREQRLGSQCRLTAAGVGTDGWAGDLPLTQTAASGVLGKMRPPARLLCAAEGDWRRDKASLMSSCSMAFFAGAWAPHLHVHHRSFTFLVR